MKELSKRSNLLCLLGLLAAFVLPGTVYSGQYQWDDDPNGVKVFILAGQSNMVGHGKTEWGKNPDFQTDPNAPEYIIGGLGSLRNLAVNDTDGVAPHYRDLLADPSDPVNSAWKIRSDVKVWWKTGYVNDTRSVRKGDLGPPFFGQGSSWIGPEFAFGQVMGDYYNHPVLIIKTAWGGIDLASGFRPPSAVADRGGDVGPYYNLILADAHEVLSNLSTEFPEFAGMGYQIVGFGWHQGWNDKIDTNRSAEYKYNLPDLISDLRAEFGKSTLPVAIATTAMGGAGDPEPYPYSGYSAVEQAQLWVAGVDQPVNVLSDDARYYWRDASVSPSDFGYHWNHNAESQYLIGTGLGTNMTEILGDPNAPDVDAGVDKITWSGQPVVMDPNVVEKPESDWTNLTYTWMATPMTGVTFAPSPNVKNPVVTITKSTDNPSTVVIKLEVNGEGRTEQGAIDTLRIDVYDTACKAAVGAGVSNSYPENLDGNCVVNLADFALLAAEWLVDGKLDSAQKM